MSAGRCGCQRMDSFRFVTFRCAGTTRFQLMQNVLKWTRISHWLLPIVKRLSPLFPLHPSLSLSLSLTRWQPPRKLKCAPNVISPVAHWVPPLPPILHFSHAFYFFVAPLNGMKVYKLSNSSCRQSVPASCQMPDANCQMPVNFWSSPKLSHDIQMA